MYYQIVPMDRSHIEQIARLEQACFSSPWTENMLADALFDTQASFIVAEDEEGNVLGYAGLHVIVDEGYIDNVAGCPSGRVLPLWRGKLGFPHPGGTCFQSGCHRPV